MNHLNIQLLGTDSKVKKMQELAENFAMAKVPVLIVGETGVGKREMAAYIHGRSKRAQEAFVVIDCSESSELVANQILGHRDDDSNRFTKGALERGHKGTVVFANIDGLEDTFQKRLHQILGELIDYDLDVRIICTTTKNLSKLVGAGKFYRGLYTMVAVNQIQMIPLRERPLDLEFAIKHYLRVYSESSSEFTDEAMKKLLKHYWGGNLSEIQDVVRRTIKECKNSIIHEDDLILGERKAPSISFDDQQEAVNLMSLRDAERMLIQKALMHTSENRTQAAKILGVSIRTLRNKINEYRNTGNPYFMNLR